jgi:hypothetical protein
MMSVGKVKKLPPIIGRDSVPSGAEMVPNGLAHRRVGLRPSSRIDSLNCNGQFGRVPVHEVAKVAQDLTAPFCEPRMCVGHLLPIFADQWIGYGIVAHIGLNVVAPVRGGQTRLSVPVRDKNRSHSEDASEEQ